MLNPLSVFEFIHFSNHFSHLSDLHNQPFLFIYLSIYLSLYLPVISVLSSFNGGYTLDYCRWRLHPEAVPLRWQRARMRGVRWDGAQVRQVCNRFGVGLVQFTTNNSSTIELIRSFQDDFLKSLQVAASGESMYDDAFTIHMVEWKWGRV